MFSLWFDAYIVNCHNIYGSVGGDEFSSKIVPFFLDHFSRIQSYFGVWCSCSFCLCRIYLNTTFYNAHSTDTALLTVAVSVAAVHISAHTQTIINNLLTPDLWSENVHDEIFQFYFMGQNLAFFLFLFTCRYIRCGMRASSVHAPTTPELSIRYTMFIYPPVQLLEHVRVFVCAIYECPWVCVNVHAKKKPNDMTIEHFRCSLYSFRWNTNHRYFRSDYCDLFSSKHVSEIRNAIKCLRTLACRGRCHLHQSLVLEKVGQNIVVEELSSLNVAGPEPRTGLEIINLIEPLRSLLGFGLDSVQKLNILWLLIVIQVFEARKRRISSFPQRINFYMPKRVLLFTIRGIHLFSWLRQFANAFCLIAADHSHSLTCSI